MKKAFVSPSLKVLALNLDENIAGSSSIFFGEVNIILLTQQNMQGCQDIVITNTPNPGTLTADTVVAWMNTVDLRGCFGKGVNPGATTSATNSMVFSVPSDVAEANGLLY